MQPKIFQSKTASVFGAVLLGLNLTGAAILPAAAQAPAIAPPAAAANRFVGTITSVGPGSLSVKTDAGVERKVTAPEGIKIQRIAPGEKDLSKAATIQFSELAVGDRVLVRIAPEPATDPVTAILIVAIPQADVAQKQQKEREDWARNGVGGLVKSVDAGTGVVVITSGAGPTQKTITLHTTPATVLRRYAPDSVSFDQAKPAPIETIRVGDQLRARGTKSPDGLEVAADEVVSGSFRNISGVISSIDKSSMTVTLKDLATKQNVIVHIGADAQMRKLPDTMAKMLASMTNPAAGDTKGGAPNRAPTGTAPANPPSPGTPPATPSGNGQQRQSYPGGQGADTASGRRGGDLQQMLSRAPAIYLADLQKGDAIMLVSTQGTSEVTAITLLSGVEPLLQAPASTQNMLLSNWNMSSGGAEAAQ
jgi:hypothetical protein